MTGGPAQVQGGSSAAARFGSLRAIIWHSAHTELPGDLIQQLSRRISKFTFCTDGCGALAEACLIERQYQAEVRQGVARPGGGILVLVQPSHLWELEEVLEAVRLYAPAVLLWSFDCSANPKLNPVVQQDVQRWRQDIRNRRQSSGVGSGVDAAHAVDAQVRVPIVQTRPIGPVVPKPVAPPAATKPSVQDSPPRMRLVGVEPELAPGEIAPSATRTGNGTPVQPPRPAAPVRMTGQLTEEELRMLLSDEPLDLPPRKRGPAGGPGSVPGGGGR